MLGLIPYPAAARSRVLSLPDDAAIEIVGASQFRGSAGDANGDGIEDLLLGTGGYGQDLDRVYVVFGTSEEKRIDVGHFGEWGFVIHGSKPWDYASIAAEAGDVNGDGPGGIVVGAPGAGRAYVVFGKKDNLPVPLALFDANAQGPLGFTILRAGGLAGRHVSGGQDIKRSGPRPLSCSARRTRCR